VRAAVCWLVLIAACGPPRFVAQEEWADVPEIRLAVLSTGGQVSAKLLDRETPFEIALGDAFTGARTAQVWILGYQLDDLRRTFPALGGRSPTEVARLLTPMIDATGGAALPRTDALLCGELDADGGTTIAYQRCDWSRWQSGGVQIRLGFPPELVCGALSVSRIEAPSGVNLLGVAAISGDAAMVAAADGLDLVLLRLDGDVLQQVAVIGRAPLQGRMSWDPVTETVIALDGARALVRRRSDGSELAIAAPPFAESVWVARDGTILAESFYLYALEAQGWVRQELVQDQVSPIEKVRMVRRSRGFLWTACWIHPFALGGEIGRETVFDGSRCVENGSAAIQDLDADEDGLVVVGENNRVAIYASGTAEEIGGSLGRGTLRAAAAVGGQRYLVGGDDGALGFWTGQQWCPLNTDPTLDFLAASSAHDRRTAYAITGAQVFRISAPEPADR
jgi:hypothetical protein